MTWHVLLGIFAIGLAACETVQGPSHPTPGQNQAPQAAFTPSVTQGPAPLQINFDASASIDIDGNIATYSWSFGDGKTDSGTTVQHTFEQVGSYPVTLTVTDNQGASASQSVTITVEGTPPSPTPDPTPDPNPTPPPTSSKNLIAAGVSIPTKKEALEEESLEIGLTAILAATQATGGSTPTLTGTLTQTGNGFSYNPSLTDRLRIEFSNGNFLEYQFLAIPQGNFEASSFRQFLRDNHNVQYRLISSEGTDANFASITQNSDYGSSVKGTLLAEGISYTVDLTTQGTYTSSAGSAVDAKSNETTQGTITSANFSAAINESARFRYFQFENAIEIRERTLNNSWTVDGDQYVLTSGYIYREWFNAKRIDTKAEGILTRNGVRIGGIGAEATEFHIDIFLLADGEKTVIYSDLKEGG